MSMLAKERRLEKLQVALVAGRQLRGDREHLEQAGEGGRRAAADELEHVGFRFCGMIDEPVVNFSAQIHEPELRV